MSRHFFKGLLFGASIGAGLSYFTGTKDGKETTNYLKDEFTDIKNKVTDVQEKKQQVDASLVHTLNTANTLLPTFEKDLKKDLEAFQFQAEPRITRIEEQLQKIKGHFQTSPNENNFEN